MSQAFADMWARKLGLGEFDEALVQELLQLMIASKADYTMFSQTVSHSNRHRWLETEFLCTQFSRDRCTVKWLVQRWRNRLTSEGDLAETSER